MKTTVGLLVLAGVPGAFAAEGGVSLTFEEAVQRALAANPGVNRAREEVQAAEATKRGAISAILPRLTGTGSLVRNSDEVTFGSGSDARTILPENDWNYRLTLSQPVYAGFREQKLYKQTRLGVDVAREGVRAAEDDTLFRVAADYLGTVEAQALLDVEERNRALAFQRLTQARNVFEAGEATRVDVLRAETAVKAAERRVVAARQLEDAAEGRLRVDLALDAVTVTVTEPADLALPPLPDETALVAQAEDRRPDLRQARAAVRIADLEVQKQKGAYLPVVTADAGYIRQRTTFPKDEYGFAALRFTVPIFQSGEVGARVAAARARLRQAELSLENARRAVREDVHTRVLGLAAARTNLALAEEQLTTAAAEYEQMFELYRSQEATALDVEASESALAEARRAVVTGRLDLRLAELAVWSAAGSLKQALVKEVK